MLYTRKGDDGTTKSFNCDQKFSKSSVIAEALGSLDEINSLLGLCKIKSKDLVVEMGSDRLSFASIIHDVQETLFIIQAQVAGAEKNLPEGKLLKVEEIINLIESELPPIKTFFISGGSENSALLDYARTVSRRAERKVVAAKEEGKVAVSKESLAYLNRLSSLLYALARLTNNESGINEEPPKYL